MTQRKKINRISNASCLQGRQYDFYQMIIFFCREKFALTILHYLRDNYETPYNWNDYSF
jgi:hypothetical protein